VVVEVVVDDDINVLTAIVRMLDLDDELDELLNSNDSL